MRGDERSVGGDDDDDGANILLPDGVLGNFAADIDACDAELFARSVVALHQDADGVAPGFGVEHAGRGADATFEFVADHARATSDIAFFNGPAMGDVESMESVFRLDVKSVDIVEIAVPSLSYDRQRPPVTFHVG